MGQLFLTIFDIVWLCSVLVFLFLIWRASQGHTQRLEKTLIDAVQTSTEAARKSAETAQLLAAKQQGTSQ